MASSMTQWKSRTLLLLAAAIVAVCMFVPYGHLAIYPFQLFGTFIHEVGHAVAVILTGGTVESLVVNPDTSGYVKSMGGSRAIVASAGYLGSVLVGAALLFAGRKRQWARPTLIAAGVATLLATAAFSGYGKPLIAFVAFFLGVSLIAYGHARSRKGGAQAHLNATGGTLVLASLAYMFVTGGLVAWIVGLLMGCALLFIAGYTSRAFQHLTVIFLGVQVSLDGLNSIQTLWTLTNHGHSHNDAATMAQLTKLPASFWAITWGLMGIAAVGGAFWMFWRDDKKKPSAKKKKK